LRQPQVGQKLTCDRSVNGVASLLLADLWLLQLKKIEKKKLEISKNLPDLVVTLWRAAPLPPRAQIGYE